MSVSEICTLITTICGIIPVVIGAVVAIVNIIKTKNWKLVQEIADKAMATVEAYSKAHPNMSSDEKLEMALEAIKSGLEAVNIKITNALLEQIKAYIKQCISWFNEMK